MGALESPNLLLPFHRGAAAAIIVYDITSADSLVRAKSWVKELQRQGNPNMIMALAGEAPWSQRDWAQLGGGLTQS